MTPTDQWMLLEPDARSPELQDGIQAPLHDPLWLLARQWQFGELWGNDTGSPVTARLHVENTRLNRYHAGPLADSRGVASRTVDLPPALPLETLVEREPVRAAESRQNARLIAEAGLHFLRLLDAQGAGRYRGDFVRDYPLARPADPEGMLDPESQRFLDVVAGRVPDAELLYQAFRRAGRSLPSAPRISKGDQQKVLRASRSWIDWYDRQTFSQPREESTDGAPNSAWVSDRIEYEFAISGHTSRGEMVLSAPEYSEGHLDWFSFVTNSSVSLGGAVDSPAPSPPLTFLPAPVHFSGMPASRFWEFEDGRLNLGRVEAGSGDPARLLLLEFALIYGNDWFLVPLDLEVGSLSRVVSLVVTNTFNERVLVPHASEIDGPDATWRMFTISPDSRARQENTEAFSEVFVLPPVLGASLEGEPIEEVLFLRDELANLAWAVERVIESEGGGRLDRLEQYQTRRRMHEHVQEDDAAPAAEGTSATPLRYCLGSSVPEYWVPLMPTQVTEAGGRPSTRLRRGVLPADPDDGSEDDSVTPGPQGHILQPDRELLLYDEEVPREGARVTRAYEYARWTDGSTFLWIGRRKRTGRGEGSSGLRFDFTK